MRARVPGIAALYHPRAADRIPLPSIRSPIVRLSVCPWSTTKEVPADAEVVSHQLMRRAGLIRKLGVGLYSWLPFGLRVMRKVERVVREEMNRAGALEVLMPSVQPAELWRESGRWDAMGKELLRFEDRAEREYCSSPP